MNNPRILVGGIGNIFLGDDAFGVEVIKRLATKSLPPGVEIVDFGIRGLDLAYTLLDDYAAAILVDAVPRGEPPGTLYVIQPKDDEEPGGGDSIEDLVETHSLNPAKVVRLVRRMGGNIDHLLVVGCEPSPLDAEEMFHGLSVPVAAAVDEAVQMVLKLIDEILERNLVNGGGRHA